jgi:heptaprenyl diphosphate synthase
MMVYMSKAESVRTDVLESAQYQEYSAAVDDAIVESIVCVSSPLATLARRFTERGGKKLRSELVYHTANARGEISDLSAVAYAGAAVELLHESTLAHDDVFDEAEMRSNRQTIYSSEGPIRASLMGIFLNNAAYIAASRVGPEAVERLAMAAAELCAGQDMEESSRNGEERALGNYFKAVELKTGALFDASCELGPIAVGLELTDREMLHRYGRNIGIAFQLGDDYLDLTSTEEEMGKPVGQDLRQNLLTGPVIHALGSSEYAERTRKWLKNPPKNPEEREEFARLLEESLALARTWSKIADHCEKAVTSLKFLPDSESVKILNCLPKIYMADIKAKQVLPPRAA